MALSTKAEGIIRALVTSGINFSNHVANSDHFDEDSAYESTKHYAKGKDGLGNCSFFDFDDDDDGGPQVYRTSKELNAPAQFTGMDAEGFKFSKGMLKTKKSEYDALVNKFNYKVKKDQIREETEDKLISAWNDYRIDKHALILAFLLNRKNRLNSKDERDRVLIDGYIPFGYVGYIIPPGCRKDRSNYYYTQKMRVVIGGGVGNPQVITAYPIS